MSIPKIVKLPGIFLSSEDFKRITGMVHSFSGYICNGDIFDAWCYSYFATTTTAWVGDPETYTITGVATPEYPEDYPHTVWAPAIVFTETAKQTGIPTTSSETAPVWSFGVTAPTTTDGVSSTSITKFKVGITAAMCSVVLIASFVAGCLFIHFRKRQTRKLADQQASNNPILPEKPYPISRPKWNFLFAILLVFPIAIFSCIFASQRDWQERLVQWTRDTSAVLQVIQVTSFLMRLFSTSLAWGVMSDCGWLLMHSGASAIEVISLLNMSVIGGNYA